MQYSGQFEIHESVAEKFAKFKPDNQERWKSWVLGSAEAHIAQWKHLLEEARELPEHFRIWLPWKILVWPVVARITFEVWPVDGALQLRYFVCIIDSDVLISELPSERVAEVTQALMAGQAALGHTLKIH